jgi:hypothetical protein
MKPESGGRSAHSPETPKEGTDMAKETVKFGPEVKGVTGSIDGKILTLTVDLSQEHGDSKTGKTTVVATTAGTSRIGGGILVGLNINKSKK